VRGAPERRRKPGFGVAPRRLQLRLDEKDAPGEIGAAKVSAPEVGPDQVGSAMVPTPVTRSSQFAGAQQQTIDVLPVGLHIQFLEVLSAVAGQAFSLFERQSEFACCLSWA
jgi:hypothetical protein